jgi:cytochrome P450
MIQLFSDDTMREPYEAYRELRDQGPVVRLDDVGAWAITRYAEVHAATENWETFSSAEGVSLTPFTNETLRGTTLASDPPLHDKLRGVVGEHLTPRALRGRRDQVQQLADEIVAGAVRRGSFDAVTDLAQLLPLTVVPDFVGWPADVRDKLLPWAAAAFETMGPPNDRSQAAAGDRYEMFQYATSLSESGNLLPGSLGAHVMQAAADGKITHEQCPPLLLDYLAPALDTTISAIGNAIWLLGRNPGQYALLREDPSLIPNAFNEALRVESPVRGFTRVATHDVRIGDVTIPAGDRVLLLWASANRDERHFPDPERFDVRRSNANSHVAFGFGVHGCAGQGLARLEGHALLTAFVRAVPAYTVSDAVPALNNTIRALESLRVTVSG